MPTMAIAGSCGTDESAGMTHLETTEYWDESRLRRNAWSSEASMTHSNSSSRAISRRLPSVISIVARARAALDWSIATIARAPCSGNSL